MEKSKKNKSGFTLVEALMSTAIVGIALAALMVANVSHSQANAYGVETSTAEFLIEEIRSLTMPLDLTDPNSGMDVFGAEAGEGSVSAYDDLDDFDGVTFNPPVDVGGNDLINFSEYSQVVTVENVDSGDLTNVVSDHGSAIVRVTVSIEMNGKQVGSSNWIRAK